MSLTVKEVRNARPGRHSDGDGLYMLVKPSGAKSWVLRVQCNGNRRDFGLGTVVLEPLAASIPIEKRKLLTLSEAREKARIGRALAKAGLNPSELWRKENEKPVVRSFQTVAEEAHKHRKNGWKNGKHKEEWLGSLRRYAFPEIGSMPVGEVDASDIQRVLLPIWLTRAETARRVKQRIASVLDYAHAHGWREREAPVRAVSQLLGAIKQPKGGNFAAMPYKDLPSFMERLLAGDLSVGKRALQFLILNASRSGEVRFARWNEIDLDAAEWRIPAEKMKAGVMHVVPLCKASIMVLEEMRELFGSDPEKLVFPGLKGPMSDATLAKVLRVNKGEGTVHGLRSTFRDWAAEIGFNNDWAEAALAHSVAGQEGKTVAAYKRTTFFDARRDSLMPAWEEFALRTGGNSAKSA